MTTATRSRSAGRSAQRAKRRGRAFVLSFVIVVGVLAVLGAGAAAASVAQGPRVTDVSIDTEAAVEASGSRVIFTTTQSLAEVDPSQVTVTPDVPFAVDTSGRTVGVRFGLPLQDETEYTVEITGVEGLGAGPATTIVETFTTPALETYLLQRDGTAGDGTEPRDIVFRTDLSGQNATAVFQHEHIEDFRATAQHLVVSVVEDDVAALIVVDRDGGDERRIPLPGDGVVSQLQSADRGEFIGFTFSDADLGESGGLESILYTVSLADPDAEPVAVEVEGADPRVSQWRFVPDTDSILLLSFDGALLLTGSAGEDATALGAAMLIDGIARGSSVAVVERADGTTEIDLTDGSEQPLVAAEGGLFGFSSVTPLPDGSTIRTGAVLEDGFPTGRTAVWRVATDGTVIEIAEVAETDALMQVCVSPSTRYLAILVAPDAVANPYDTYLLPLPERVETHVLDLADGTERVALSGSSISWCQVPPA